MCTTADKDDGVRAGQPYVRISRHGSVLKALRDPSCVLALWEREVAASLADVFDGLPLADLPAFETVGAIPDIRRAAHEAIGQSALRGHAAGRWLESDLTGLCCRCAVVTGIRRVHVRLAAVADDGCRYFHVDRLSLRLLCSYRGSGMQWIAPGTPVSGTNGPQLTEELEAAPRFIREVPTRAVALFRGHEPADTAGHGLLHRSPPTGAQAESRLVLTLSIGGSFS
jgi:hypothetical protein